MKKTLNPIHIIGGGLAGCEAAWQIARQGAPVIIHEMRPDRKTEAHETSTLAELVCSNSFRSDDAAYNAVGLLHQEMRALSSLILSTGDTHKVPAGGALAVDRKGFADAVQHAIISEPLISVNRGEINGLPPEEWDNVIIATGPLTSPPLGEAICRLTGHESLYFFDAIAPIVTKDSINFDKAWFQSRYDKGEGSDYINCPMDEQQYDRFHEALLTAEKIEFKEWEKNTPYFEGCLPIEVMAERGRDTLRFGPMKPVGLTNPHLPGKQKCAVVQLRQDNSLGTLYNIVGFQTKLKYAAQKEVFRLIPGLENAEFVRLGGIHRNTFINSPKLLDKTLCLTTAPRLRFAGQITGCEGYVESAGIGLLAGRFAAAKKLGYSFLAPPKTTALGALLSHITSDAHSHSYQPMNVNFGLFPDLLGDDGKQDNGRRLKGRDRKRGYTQRAARDFQIWLEEIKEDTITPYAGV
ncbi:MAG: methylenetetrahydrofolate--tRNA-(uracil(54)-C(5))-methyltransferase (FADH(2)-oxidizing) TrmFO [Rhodospirillaceae bacterium]